MAVRGRGFDKSSPSGAGTVPGALPVLGHTLALLRDPLRFLSSLPAYGSLPVVRLGPMTMRMACTPELTGQILRDDRTFDKGGPVYEQQREGMGNGLGTCARAQHRRQRRLCQPAFHQDRLPDYAGVMALQTAETVHAWQDGQVLDVHTEMMAMTARIAVDTMFAEALSPAEVRQALRDLNTVLTGVYRRAVMPPALTRLPTPANRRWHQARARLWATLAAVIKTRRDDPTDHGDLLSALLTARDKGDDTGQDGLDDEEAVSQVVTFFAGGAETSSATLSWALHLLAEHPEIERRVHAEAEAALGGDEAQFEHLPALPFTRNVITETLRLYPPGWFFTRVATADVELDGQLIRVDDTVAYSPYLIHRRSELYSAPEEFRPDRWEKDAHPSRDAFIPFGGGARRCIGDQFALTHAILALASISTRWRLESASPRVRPAVGLVLHPRGLRMRALARR